MSFITVLAEVPAPAFSAFRTLAQTPAPVAAPAPGDPGAPQPSMLSNLMLPILLAGMYFLFIAPQMKRTKEHKKLLADLKSGDEIVTSGGIHGEIVQVKTDRFVVEIAKGVRIEINRGNVEARVSAPALEVVDADASADKKL